MSDETNEGARPARFKVLVLFHGLWAFETRPDKILAHTPVEEEHDIRAGFYEIVGSGDNNQFKPVASGCIKLQGVESGNKNYFRDDLNIVLPQKRFHGDSLNRRFCCVELPLPDDIRSVRNVKVTPPPHVPFAGEDGEDLKPKYVSMVQVFTYHSYDIKKVRLSGSKARPHIDYKTHIAKFNVHAEPASMTHGSHAMDAYMKLADLFDLEIVPIAPLYTPPVDPQIDGLTREDTRSLMEWLMDMPSITMAAGQSGSNCDALVIDNTKLNDGLKTDPCA